MQGVILDGDSLAPDDLDLSPITNHLESWEVHPQTQPAETAIRLQSATVAVTNKVIIDAEIINKCPQLKLIAVSATGTNNVDLMAAQKRGITVCNATGYGTASVTQHVLALILAITNRVMDYNRAAKDGTWEKAPFFCFLDYPVMQLAGKKLGIVGYGELGQGVAKLAEAFGMEILVSQRPDREQDTIPDGRLAFSEVIQQCDILTLHCPLTAQTENLIAEKELSQMKKGSFLINCARGGIVNEQALADSLRNGHLAGAASDVLTKEPPESSNPLLANDIPNLIITPHMAWASREARQQLVNTVGENIQAWLNKKTQNIVNL